MKILDVRYDKSLVSSLGYNTPGIIIPVDVELEIEDKIYVFRFSVNNYTPISPSMYNNLGLSQSHNLPFDFIKEIEKEFGNIIGKKLFEEWNKIEELKK